MKTTTKKLSDTKVELKVTLDAADLKTARDRALTHLATNLKVQGFRKGKAPIAIAEKNIPENEINTTTLELAVRSTVPAAFAKANQAPIAVNDVSVTKYVPNEVVEYTAIADVLPEVKLGDYKKLKVEFKESEPTKADVQEIVDSIVQGYAEKVVVKRPAQEGDEVIIDFTGKLNGEAFQGGSAKDYHLILGSHQFIPGFEEGIVGHSSGDRFDLELTFPKDYPQKTLAGQKTIFSVLVKQVNELQKPKEDDALAEKCGFKTMDELRADIKKNLQAQNDHRALEEYREALVAELVKASKVSAPEILIEDQLHFIKDDMHRNAAARGMQLQELIESTGQKFEDWEKRAREVAEERVKSSLVLQILAREQNIAVSDAEADAKIAELRDLYRKSKEAIDSLKKPEVRQDIKNRLTIEKTLEFLVNSHRQLNSAKPKAKAAAKKPAATVKKPAAKKATKKSDK